MKPLEVAKGIYWVGAIDWNIRDFHGYSTKLGTTYNAFLIVDDKVTLVDIVKKEFADELIDRISQIVDPKKIDYVVSNHTEMDHSGGLARVMHRIGEDKPVYCSKAGHKNLTKHFPQKWNYQPVEDGGPLEHWKENPGLHGNKNASLAGQHVHLCQRRQNPLLPAMHSDSTIAGLERFDDQIGDAIMPHARKYFANILLPYAPLILKLVEKVKSMGLALDMILSGSRRSSGEKIP